MRHFPGASPTPRMLSLRVCALMYRSFLAMVRRQEFLHLLF